MAIPGELNDGDLDPGKSEIFTIGHAALPIGDFIDLLHRHGIDLLVDIRRFPGSRHAPQFGEDLLRSELEAAGIGYVHLAALGGRRRAQPDSPNGAWRNASFRGYADYMETDEFRHGLGELEELARGHRVAIMCAESVWWRCHRSMVADAMKAAGWQVRHIMSDGSARPHSLTAPARIVDGKLTYHEAPSVPEQIVE
ncbi:MAG TPA: DUF488 domain-containing protein [Thermomicrobiales bacterium]|nr:DUF488 domain-containing protein [Thermomicrobiales bacterium]